MSRHLLAFALVAVVLVGCGADPDRSPLRIAFIHPPIPDGSGGGLEPNVAWALEQVNAAGGVAGRPLIVDSYDQTGLSPEQALQRYAEIAADQEHVAAIGPGASLALLAAADRFVLAQKPIISPYSTSADVLRAYGGQGYVWRTRESDIAQTELLLRFALGKGAGRVALITTLDAEAITFFNWFAFLARELGYGDDAVTIAPIEDGQPCDAAVTAALEADPDLVVAAIGAPEVATCVALALARPPGTSGPRVVFADTGFDSNALRLIGPGADHFEGFHSVGSEEYERAFRERLPGAPLAPHGAGLYDAVLLLAYGLELSGGEGGEALDQALRAAVDGRDPGPYGWDRDGVAATLAALRAGSHPDISGATGGLEFEPDLYVDLAASTLTHWTMGPMGPISGDRYFTGDPSFLTSGHALVTGSGDGQSSTTDTSGWSPPAARADVWALIAALSTGWPNYRHQADALRQYQLLRARGVPDDHIVLVLADDLATHPANPLPGVVRNTPGGEDLHHDLEIDYDLSITASDLVAIITGEASPRLPAVLHTTAASNLYIYLVGHGGERGLPIGASTVSAGLAGQGSVLSPDLLRQALCDQRAASRMRRALVVIESCHGGAFGDARHAGIEQGCGPAGEETPLRGVTLLSAASAAESSVAAGYDPALGVWVGDDFSQHYAAAADRTMLGGILPVYVDTYARVAGSHVSLYNAAASGRLADVSLAEFLAP